MRFFRRAAVFLFLFHVLSGLAPAIAAGILDTRTYFNIKVPEGWTARKWPSSDVALEARSPEKDGLLLVLALGLPFVSKFEAAAAFEEREEFTALSPVQTRTGTVHTVSGWEGILRQYNGLLNGADVRMTGAFFGRHDTWYGVLAAWPPEDEAMGARLEQAIKNFRPGFAPPSEKDPIEGLWRWQNGSLLNFGPGGAITPARIVLGWRKDYPQLPPVGQTYFLNVKLPGKSEIAVVISEDGKKMYELDGNGRTQIAARVE